MAAVSPRRRANGIAPLSPPADADFAVLYERHASRVLGFCLRWLRSREEAEDAAQTTFLHAWRALGRGEVPQAEAAWLLAIARNVCLTRADAARRRVVEIAQDPHVLEDTLAAPARAEEVAGLPEALGALTEQQRRALVMREWRGLSYREIACELELSQSAVETLLFRARRSLAARLRRPAGAASSLPWLKSLVGGGAAKLTAGAALVVVTAAAGTVAELSTPGAAPAPASPTHARAAAAAPVSAPSIPREPSPARRVSRPRRQAPTRRQRPAVRTAASPAATIAAAAPAPIAPPAPPRGAATAIIPRPSAKPAATTPAPAPAIPAAAPVAAGPVAAGPVAAGPVAVGPAQPPAAQPVATLQTTTTGAVDAVQTTASAAVDTVQTTASAAVDTVQSTATATVDAAQGAVSGAVQTVQSAVPAVQPPPLPKLLP